jgi:hypothetical protein
VLPRHAGRVRRVRDQPPARAATLEVIAKAKGRGRLQGPPRFDRCRPGARDEGAGAQNWPCVGLSGARGRMIPSECAGPTRGRWR